MKKCILLLALCFTFCCSTGVGAEERSRVNPNETVSDNATVAVFLTVLSSKTPPQEVANAETYMYRTIKADLERHHSLRVFLPANYRNVGDEIAAAKNSRADYSLFAAAYRLRAKNSNGQPIIQFELLLIDNATMATVVDECYSEKGSFNSEFNAAMSRFMAKINFGNVKINNPYLHNGPGPSNTHHNNPHAQTGPGPEDSSQPNPYLHNRR